MHFLGRISETYLGKKKRDDSTSLPTIRFTNSLIVIFPSNLIERKFFTANRYKLLSRVIKSIKSSQRDQFFFFATFYFLSSLTIIIINNGKKIILSRINIWVIEKQLITKTKFCWRQFSKINLNQKKKKKIAILIVTWLSLRL